MRKLFLTLLFLLTLSATALAVEGKIPLAVFIQRLERAAEAVEQNRVAEAVLQFPDDQAEVEAPGGPVAVDMYWLRSALSHGTSPASRVRVAAQLRQMAREARQVAGAGRPGLEERLKQAATDRERLKAILNSAGYREAEPSSLWGRLQERLADWWSRQADRVSQWWERQWEWVPDVPGLPKGSGARMAGLFVVLLLLGVILYLARDFLSLERLRKLVRRKRQAAAEQKASQPDDLRRAAMDLAAAGKHREAIKALMQAVLTHLGQRRLIDCRPMLTNRGYLAQIRRRRPDLYPPLEELNRLYEWKIYGRRPATAEEFRRGLELVERLWEEGSSSAS